MKGLKVIGLLCALLGAGQGWAQDDGERGPRGLEGTPWYVSPMFSYTDSDSDRGTDGGLGGILSVGKKLTWGLTVEATGFYSTMDAKSGGGSAELNGYGASALFFPSQTLPNLFGVVSLMVGHTSDLPGPRANYDSTVFDVGLGYLQPVTRHIMIRAEARYRTDAKGSEPTGAKGKDSNFAEGVYNLGLLFPFGLPEEQAQDSGAEIAAITSADDDNDGVPNDADQCPNTPAGAVVDANGCEADADADGVPDRADQCPDTPAGMQVDDKGCPLDGDGDGVLDTVDECPHTPAGAKVLANGCALVGDCRTPKAGEQVDANGCAVDKRFVLKGVKFEFDSDRLTDDAKTVLAQVAETLQAYPDVKVEIQGHTDNIGSDAYNQGLSERRARVVKAFLAEHGVAAARMSPVGYGESQPIESNDTEQGRENNRRVELKVME
ncbi:OmpA family protein [Solimonas flava]|uniref:OmpA family protein n=1 Tax=Solimonas flava TaxID=415849 RepID=UPI0004211B0C|nr:OmpA family protein [Solimonas flava]